MQSLLQAELMAARGKRGVANLTALSPGRWSDAVRISGSRPDDLGCDSLEALWLSSAACEMFDLADAGRHHALASSDFFGEWLDIVERAWRDGLSTISFSTSGTTGRPKRCTHKLSDLDSEVRHFAGVFRDSKRVLAFVPPHHIYGFLFASLLPDVLDADCYETNEATRALGALKPGDLIVAFPERWRWIERVVRRFGTGIKGVTSTAHCPLDLVEALNEAGLDGLTEVYGSSETAGIGTRRWPDSGYQLLPRWSFGSQDGRDMLVSSSGETAAFPDTIQRIGPNAFIPTGRVDGAVQVGGINVYPERIALELCDRAGVAEAAVRLMRPEEGSRLKAFIVPDGSIDQEALLATLTFWVSQIKDAAGRPVDFRFGQQLPRNFLGKPTDW